MNHLGALEYDGLMSSNGAVCSLADGRPPYHASSSRADGGSVGAILGMQAFRHKTQHLKFRFGLPLILASQLIITGYVVYVIAPKFTL